MGEASIDATAASEQPTGGEQPIDTMSEKEKSSLNLIYILYFIGFIFPFTSLAGLIIAYLRRSEYTDEMGKAHLTWVIVIAREDSNQPEGGLVVR